MGVGAILGAILLGLLCGAPGLLLPRLGEEEEGRTAEPAATGPGCHGGASPRVHEPRKAWSLTLLPAGWRVCHE